MKLWKNLSKEQKRMAKIAIFNTLMTSIIMVIIKPIVKGEAFIVTDKLIEFLIFIVVLFAFNCIFIIGARTPEQKQVIISDIGISPHTNRETPIAISTFPTYLCSKLNT